MDAGMLGLVIFIILVAAVVLVRVQANQRVAREQSAAKAEYDTRLWQAKRRYDEALNAVRQDATKRQAALDAGRKYSEVTRERQGGSVTVYDEMALMNDINAAVAAAPSLAPAAPPVASTAARLQQLEELRGQGLVSDAEYQARRAKILEGV